MCLDFAYIWEEILSMKEKAAISHQGELICGGQERGRTLLLMAYLCSFIFKWQLSEAAQCLEHEIKSQERWIR